MVSNCGKSRAAAIIARPAGFESPSRTLWQPKIAEFEANRQELSHLAS